MNTIARLVALFIPSPPIATRLDAFRALNDRRLDGERQPGLRVVYARPHPKLKIGCVTSSDAVASVVTWKSAAR